MDANRLEPRKNIGRPPLAPGAAGQPWVKEKTSGSYTATVWIRTAQGRRRQVSASGKSKTAALGNLHRRLSTLLGPPAMGVQANWTVAEATRHWRRRKERVGSDRGRRPLKPQTLAAIDGEIRRIVDPSMGAVRLDEVTIAFAEALLAEVEDQGLSTEGARNVLNGTFNLAVRDGAMRMNPMPYVARAARECGEIEALDVETSRHLRASVHPDSRRIPGRRGPNRDLFDFVTLCLGTGMRAGECLALRHQDVDLEGAPARVTVSGTMIEPKRKPHTEWEHRDHPEFYVPTHQRQPATKNNLVRILVLPEVVADQLRERRVASRFTKPHDPLLASGSGTHLWASNLRIRLRSAITGDPRLVGITPHTLRRTVATVIAYEFGLDAARMQLGHSLIGTTSLSRYVAHRPQVSDYTSVLEPLLT
jgi:integrase